MIFLITGLSEAGAHVLRQKEGAWLVDFDTQLIVSQKMDKSWESEVVLTMSLLDSKSYLYRRSEVYAVDRMNVKLYETAFEPQADPSLIKTLKLKALP